MQKLPLSSSYRVFSGRGALYLDHVLTEYLQKSQFYIDAYLDLLLLSDLHFSGFQTADGRTISMSYAKQKEKNIPSDKLEYQL